MSRVKSPVNIINKKGVTMTKLLRLAAAAAVSASLTTGLAAAQTGSIDTTGPNSSNHVTVRSSQSFRQTNNNHVHASNTNSQSAGSGDATVQNNTNGGSASSGSASNSNSTSASVSVSNSSMAGGLGAFAASDPSGSISTTGPNSTNTVHATSSSHVNVTNNNKVYLTNTSTQTATSGNATVQNNTNAGDASTGDASNTNSSTFDISIDN
jgi:hypothetical protein